MGEVNNFHTKEQLEILDNINMYRLLFLFEIVTFMQKMDDTQMKEGMREILDSLPLVTQDHYRFILEYFRLPDDLLNHPI